MRAGLLRVPEAVPSLPGPQTPWRSLLQLQDGWHEAARSRFSPASGAGSTGSSCGTPQGACPGAARCWTPSSQNSGQCRASVTSNTSGAWFRFTKPKPLPEDRCRQSSAWWWARCSAPRFLTRKEQILVHPKLRGEWGGLGLSRLHQLWSRECSGNRTAGARKGQALPLDGASCHRSLAQAPAAAWGQASPAVRDPVHGLPCSHCSKRKRASWLPAAVLLGRKRSGTSSLKHFAWDEADAWNGTSLASISSSSGATHTRKGKMEKPFFHFYLLVLSWEGNWLGKVWVYAPRPAPRQRTKKALPGAGLVPTELRSATPGPLARDWGGWEAAAEQGHPSQEGIKTSRKLWCLDIS